VLIAAVVAYAAAMKAAGIPAATRGTCEQYSNGQ